MIRSYTAGGSTVAVRKTGSSGAGLYWMLGDQQGSVSIAVNATDATFTRDRYLPHGGNRATTAIGAPGLWTMPTDRSWIGQIQDKDTGLDYLNNRYSDPALAHFTSTDPLNDQTTPQDANPYAYASDNPITFTDPLGLASNSYVVQKGGENWNTIGAKFNLSLAELRTLNGGSLSAVHVGQKVIVGPKPPSFITGFSDGVGGAAKELISSLTPSVIYDGIKNAIQHPWETLLTLGKAIIHLDEIEGAYNAWRSGDMYHFGYYLGKLVFGIAVNAIAYIGGGALVNVVKGIRAAKDGAKATEAAAAAGKTTKLGKAEEAAVSCPMSFSGDTAVLMADGTTKPIKDIKVGDKVEASDPATGVITAEPVTATHLNDDHNLLDLTVHTPKGDSVIHTTTNHPFYDDTTHSWTDAERLVVGHRLRTTTREVSMVAALTAAAGHAWMNNLTIEDFHTYFVLASNTPVLVHNCDGKLSDPLPQGMSRAIVKAYDDIRAGRLASHDIFQGREVYARSWAGAEEYRVPGANDSTRILVKMLSSGQKVMGWTTDHYKHIYAFSAPHFPDSGWR
ncbi:MAG TPA: polymorphic toxin-type HINT domain-containing protein [Kineosporiaceae bacterium]